MEDTQPPLSTSAETIRSLPTLYIPAQSSSRSQSHSRSRSRPRSPSRSRADSPSSPHSSWPSPSSPSGESVSSLPSVGSSFLFSSVPASPPHHHEHLPHRHSRLSHGFDHHDFGEGDRSLIIPSLTLPTALRPPTAHGHALGHVRLLVLGCSAAEDTTQELLSLLTDPHCPELVHVRAWEDFTLAEDEEVAGQRIRMSTDWIEHRDVHGEDRYEPSCNVDVVRMRDYNSLDEPSIALQPALSIIQASFRSAMTSAHGHLEEHPSPSSSTTPAYPLSSLLSRLLERSPSDEPLYTAAVLVPSTPPTPTDQQLITELRKHIPLIVLPSVAEDDTPKPLSDTLSSSDFSPSDLSSTGVPLTPSDVRTTLYQNPHAITLLRREAAELFLQWAGYSAESIADAVMDIDRGEEGSPVETAHPREELTSMAMPQLQNPIMDTDRLDGTVKARSGPHKLERQGSKTRGGSGVTKGSSRGTVRGRPRGSMTERRKTITSATHSRPVIGPLARPDSLASPPRATTPSSPLSPPLQSRRRRYAAEHGLTASSATAYSHSAAPLPPTSFSTFDPLHFPSLVRLALEGLLLGPLRLRLARLFGGDRGQEASVGAVAGKDELSLAEEESQRGKGALPIALIAGAFCAGVGVGVILARSRI